MRADLRYFEQKEASTEIIEWVSRRSLLLLTGKAPYELTCCDLSIHVEATKICNTVASR